MAQFRDTIKTAVEEEREACAKVADDYVIKADELKRKIEQQREKGSTGAFLSAEDAPMVDGKIAVARRACQKIAEDIRAR